jgi:hypothetical protein
VSGGIVRFQGAISGGTTANAFTLPAAMSPPVGTYVTADMYFAAKGRIYFPSSSTPVTIQTQSGTLSDATNFTSLEGVWFALASTGYTPLTLTGWTTYSGSRPPAALAGGGIVRLQGEMSTTGTSAAPFVLPAAFRPAANVYVPVNLCGANKGRLNITSDGTVSVQPEGGTVANFMCFTSLEGVFFGL